MPVRAVHEGDFFLHPNFTQKTRKVKKLMFTYSISDIV